MFRKQRVKMNHGKRLVSSGLLGLMLMGSMSATVLAGNVTDTYYNQNCGVTGFSTPARAKQDDTSAYIYHQGSRPANVRVCSDGVNYSANGSFYYVDTGKAVYLPNYVKENRRDSCYLHLVPSPSGSCNLYGCWSPDSV